jgi:uncharacterized protein
MSLVQEILAARKDAMVNKETAALDALRVLCSELKNEEIKIGKELTDDQAQAIVARQVKQARDAQTDFEKGGREDLVSKAEEEIRVLSAFLPAQLRDEQLRAVISEALASAGESPNMGAVMGAVMGQVKGKADGVRVKQMVQEMM